jgi:rod shape determining protein RodA
MAALRVPSLERRWELFRRLDLWLILSAVLLLGIGLMCLYSVDRGGNGSNFFRNQLFRVGIGILPFSIFFFLDPKWWRRYASAIYMTNLALLALVLVKGRTSGGAQRWIQLGPIDFQPSEIAKLLVVLTLASFFLTRLDKIKSFTTFGLSFLHVLPVVLLVFKQPHLGATLVILVAWLTVSLGAGVRLRYLVGSVLAVAVALTFALQVPGVLKSYQRERVKALLDPNTKGNAYQPLRAQIAFGVGGVTGVGYLKGEQKMGHYIPEQQNDFIFTVMGEEGGLIGCLLVLGTYGFFYFRVWLVMLQADDSYFRMVTAGIFGILAFHTIVNLGMNLQLLPVVGLWLPFMSYGGSAMWLCMACVALLLNMRSRQRPVLF